MVSKQVFAEQREQDLDVLTVLYVQPVFPVCLEKEEN
jgi:hypothetical protein